MSIHDALVRRRKALGLTVWDMEDKGVSHESLWYAENGLGKSGSRLATLGRIAQALGCRIEIRLVDERTGEEIE